MTPLRGWVLAIAVAALCATAGRWQLGRMHQKQAMLDALAQVISQRVPTVLGAAAIPAAAHGYAWAAGSGDYLASPAVLLDNQQRGGQVGVRVYRAYAPRQGMPLLVELGWLALPDRTQLPQIAMPAPGRVAGLLMPPPSAGLAAQQIQRTGDAVLVTRLEPAAIAAALGLPALAPRILRLDPAQPGGYARDLDILPNTLTPQRHLGYAVQWFGLALAALVTAAVLHLRSVRR